MQAMKIQTTILTGANNHDWGRSAPFCRDLLEGTGRFEVSLVTDPSTSLMEGEGQSPPQLYFVDYNGPDWEEPAQENLIQAIRAGAGICILHAANNGFAGWKAFEEMCALSWRAGSAHGAYHRFDVRISDPEHPITRGLPPVLRDHPDELYHGLVHMHEAPYTVLATACSSHESGGSGKEEPVIVVRTYGRGRVFHCILGHVYKGGGMETFENPDFQKLLLRGCEWAATGDVSI
jgi:type 1 glutamine amidotransferase